MEADVRDFLRRFYYAISGDAPDGTWPNDKTGAAPPCSTACSTRIPSPPG